MQTTVDPFVVIEARGEEDGVPFVRYRSVPPTVTRPERWVIRGTCCCCGECEVGAVSEHLVWTGIPVGQPGACLDRRGMDRPDVPVRPELCAEIPACSLSGEYL